MAAEIDSRLVRGAIKRIRDTSQELKTLVRGMFEQLEANPAVYKPLDYVDPELAGRFPRAVFRKVYLRHQRHDFRVVFVHGRSANDIERVKLLLAFDREDGWRINWEILKESLGDEFP
jgi:hypothetical protein